MIIHYSGLSFQFVESPFIGAGVPDKVALCSTNVLSTNEAPPQSVGTVKVLAQNYSFLDIYMGDLFV